MGLKLVSLEFVLENIKRLGKALIQECALRVRAILYEAVVDLVLSLDKTFVEFHECTGKFCSSKGNKKVGSALKFNKKDGFAC